MASETDSPADTADAGPVDAPNARVVVYVVAFAATFVLLGAAAPASYHAVQPADHYVSVQDPQVVGVADDDPCEIRAETAYWSRHGEVIDVETTLYDIGGEADTQVQRWHKRGYIQPGIQHRVTSWRVDEPLENGTYQFRFVVDFEAEYGWDKTLEVYSEPFRIHHGTENDSERLRPESGGTAIMYPSNTRC